MNLKQNAQQPTVRLSQKTLPSISSSVLIFYIGLFLKVYAYLSMSFNFLGNLSRLEGLNYLHILQTKNKKVAITSTGLAYDIDTKCWIPLKSLKVASQMKNLDQREETTSLLCFAVKHLVQIWNKKVFPENDCLLFHKFVKTTYLDLLWCVEILNRWKKDRMDGRGERARKREGSRVFSVSIENGWRLRDLGSKPGRNIVLYFFVTVSKPNLEPTQLTA
jgi:hypothetical protein